MWCMRRVALRSIVPYVPRSARATERAGWLLRECWDGERVALPLNAMARRLGVEVRGRGGEQEADYPWLGRLTSVDGRPLIEVNMAYPNRVRRVVAAHALGHHLLEHGDMPPETPRHFLQEPEDFREAEATQFALDLLIPTHAVRRIYPHEVYKAEELRRLFEVPNMTVLWRLTAMGYR